MICTYYVASICMFCPLSLLIVLVHPKCLVRSVVLYSLGLVGSLIPSLNVGQPIGMKWILDYKYPSPVTGIVTLSDSCSSHTLVAIP